MSAAPHILFAGGGAAGHLFPGIAVASHLSQKMPEAQITFAGPGRASEKYAVRSAGYHYTSIPAQPVPQNPLQAFRFVTDNVAGYCAAKWMLREKQISLVVGLGGFTSTAVVRAAAARDIPFLLLEQNAIPSRTTRWMSSASARVCAGYKEVKPHLSMESPVAVTGNPVRPDFEQLYERTHASSRSSEAATIPFSQGNQSRQKRVVILGGAGGARSLNESMPKALKQLGKVINDWQVIHQTGEGQLQETESRYRQYGVDAIAVAFIDEIASVLFASDVVICRAGGTTLAELALAGVPAILVPYPLAIDDHQIANAKVVASAGACRLIDETSQSLDRALATELSTLLADEHLRSEMNQKMQRLAQPHASADIAAMIQETLCGSQSNRLAA